MHSNHKHAINTSGDDAMNRIPQAQPGIALLECPWDPLKKEGVDGHAENVGERERERADPHLDRGSTLLHHHLYAVDEIGPPLQSAETGHIE